MSKEKKPIWEALIDWVDLVTKPIIYLSVILLLVETEWGLREGWTNSYQSPAFFLWSERIFVLVFTVGILARWVVSNPTYYGTENTRYPLDIFGFIDVLSVLPFFIGFLVPEEWLGLVRTLRILRLFMLFRYSRDLQLTALKYYRAWHNCRGVVLSFMIPFLFFGMVFLALEHEAQPEEFNSLVQVAWFTVVTGTTVGYGDQSPVTVVGKIFVGMMLIPMIASLGMIISAFSEAATRVQEMEDDPDVDPIHEFRLERQRRRTRKMSGKEYRKRK